MKDNTKEEKVCTKCGVLKKKCEFTIIKDYKQNSMKLFSFCNSCKKEALKKHKKEKAISKKLYNQIIQDSKVSSSINVNKKPYTVELPFEIPSTKVCCTCKEEKSLSEFEKTYKRGLKEYQVRSNCKVCINVVRRKREKKRVEKRDLIAPDEKDMQQTRSRFKKLSLDSGLDISYKFMTTDWYINTLKSQNGRCKICEKTPQETGKRLFIDHCHTTGKVRGLLCHYCNTGIGYLYDNPETLRKAALYVEENL